MLIGVSGYIGAGKDVVAKMIEWLTSNHADRPDLNTPEAKFKMAIEYSTKDIEINRRATWQIKKFAGKLKEICSLLTGIPVSQFEQQSVKDSFLGDEWAHWAPLKCPDRHFRTKENCESWISTMPFGTNGGDLGGPIYALMTVRELLQKMGTDAMRDNVHPNIHINALFSDYKSTFGCKNGCEQGKDSGIPGAACIDPKYCYNQVEPNWIISDCRFPNEAQAIKDKGGIVIRVNRKYMCHDPKIVRPEHVKKGINLDMPQIRHSSETSLDNWKFDWVLENDDTLEELLGQVAVMLKENNLL